ncbi:hypothetical protein J8F10_34165 [Gemmata sp. G18]|uniref:DUF7660 domain-containing protein n=1 Tax=Gemmata palustris TaxID=2822762 RepID=A0ABS5C2T1_9BACT|nr:hypothetical protein [Gemmata palustris]MBP3960301.1 hypothetical protein [Gemmata palustris]
MSDATDPLDPATVHDRVSFLQFVRALAADYRRCAPNGRMACSDHPSPYSGLWENLDLGTFLDSGADWVEHLGSGGTDFPGADADFPAQPTWPAFAAFLFLCKSYYAGRDTQ